MLFLLVLATPVWSKPLYFAQLTDTHLESDADWQRTEKAIETINNLPFDLSFVAVTGDVFSDNWNDPQAVKRAKELFEKIPIPCRILPGNHDIDYSKEDSIRSWQKAFGPLFQEASYGGAGFAFVYTVPLAREDTPLPFKPLENLRAYLQKDPKRPTFVFTHIPSAEDFYNNEMHPGWPEKNEKAWEEVLGAGNVKAVITGHFHRDEMHWIGDIPLFVCPPIADTWGRQAALRVYDYENGHLSYRTLYLN
jgi:DNA repair exonuclease SbcCD nuclease subunit